MGLKRSKIKDGEGGRPEEGEGGSREDDHRGYIFPDPDLESESSAFPSFRERKALAIPHDDPWRGGCPLLGWVDCLGCGSGLGRWVPWIYFQPVVRGNSGGEQQYRHVPGHVKRASSGWLARSAAMGSSSRCCCGARIRDEGSLHVHD